DVGRIGRRGRRRPLAILPVAERAIGHQPERRRTTVCYKTARHLAALAAAQQQAEQTARRQSLAAAQTAEPAFCDFAKVATITQALFARSTRTEWPARRIAAKKLVEQGFRVKHAG